MSWTLPYAAHLGMRGPALPLFRHSARSTEPFDQIDFIADLGFTGVQDNYAALRPAQEQTRVAQHAARRGLRMGSFVHDPRGWHLPRWSAPDADSRAALMAQLDRSFETARRIGGSILTCVTGFDAKLDRQRQLAAMADNLRRAGDLAAAAGVVCCVEMTSPRWLPAMLVETFDDAIALVRTADHPAVKLMFDVGHLALNGHDLLATFQKVHDLVAAVQLADVPAGAEPGRIDVGAGLIVWTPLLRAICASGYAGLYEIELEAKGAGLAGERQMLETLRSVDTAL
ncbi:sugar phosphate isomerase/epimerase family protein [Croceicoccus sp. F390]|uniref:Sugar phosphate isomerase/epimerase family protein n=1 Tax=Croceicoccus esteveae TaxID=3075597 RepID=A0ABU2ZH08_9SPHN|nr:sugar phosphate isomerase/epimerase family protein [Croceicoccus sp. F390]MDT0575888.1 sugar phosphate isomerase/epimerase family protein [Croceicoccus sp. F390]